MSLQTLEFRHLRNLFRCALELREGANLLCGPNGSGKTTVLEGVWLLGTGRSFRAASSDGCLAAGAQETRLRAVAGGLPVSYAKRRGQRPVMRLGANPARSASSLARALPLALVDSGTLGMLAGLPQQRRAFVNAGAFHLSQDFHVAWRSYRDALRQRNAALKLENPEALDAWETLLDAHGAAIAGSWRSWMQGFEAELHGLFEASGHPFLARMQRELRLRIHQGWAEGASLGDELRRKRRGDRLLGHTTEGPHRGDLAVELDGQPAAATLSAGERKLLTAAMLLAQAALPTATLRRARPVLLMDDLSAELDGQALTTLLRLAQDMPNQKLMTCIDEAAFLRAAPPEMRRQLEDGGTWHMQDLTRPAQETAREAQAPAASSAPVPPAPPTASGAP